MLQRHKAAVLWIAAALLCWGLATALLWPARVELDCVEGDPAGNALPKGLSVLYNPYVAQISIRPQVAYIRKRGPDFWAELNNIKILAGQPSDYGMTDREGKSSWSLDEVRRLRDPSILWEYYLPQPKTYGCGTACFNPGPTNTKTLIQSLFDMLQARTQSHCSNDCYELALDVNPPSRALLRQLRSGRAFMVAEYSPTEFTVLVAAR